MRLPMNVARPSDTSCQLLTLNFEIWSWPERTGALLLDRWMAGWAICKADVEFFFKKAVLRCLQLMRNNTQLLWWMQFMGRAVSEADVWLLWSAAPKENIAFSAPLTIPSLSPSFLFFFDGHTLCQPVLCFQGIRAHGSASLSSRRLLSECLCSPGRGCLVVVYLDVLC